LKAAHTAASLTRHTLGAVTEAVLILAVIVGLVIGYAAATRSGPFGAADTFAAKGGGGHGHGGGGTSATITVPDGVYASTVTATVSPAGLWVYAKCSQGGSMVYGQYAQSDADGHAVLTLGPTSWWTGGPASCTAEAGNWSARNGQWVAQGSTTFNVSG